MSVDHRDVGHRVVVRRLLPGETGPSGGPALTDVLGILESWSTDQLRIRHEDGTVLSIETSLVIAARRVPDRPPPR